MTPGVAPGDLPALEICGVSKSFGPKQVLDSIDLTVGRGSITAVLGPSGGGKTTLLRIIAGFEHPDAGSVHVAGSLVASVTRSVPAERRNVGIVPQEGALFPHLDVAGNVGFGLARGSMPAAGRRERIAELLELVGLGGFEPLRPDQLSGGQQHRVALARALAPNPSLVLLDEPFSSLDAGLRGQVREDVVHALRATGATAVMVTHDQQEAMAIADRVAVLLDGRIAQVDEPAVLYRRPVSLAVGRFIGDAVVVTAVLAAGRAHGALGEFAAPGCADGAASLLLRPESLRIVAIEHVGAVAATVLSRQFFGHDALTSLRLSDGQRIAVRGATDVHLSVGEAVGVVVDGDPVVFPGGPASPPSS